MYITISPQKLGDKYSTSVADYVDYLEKENTDRSVKQQEYFFDQTNDQVKKEEVALSIDQNTSKLKSSEPRYYSLTINPSNRELLHLNNDPAKLKAYTRSLMEDYAGCFHRTIDGRAVKASDILYFGKLEYSRTFKEGDLEVRENSYYSKRIAKLQNDRRKIQRGELQGNKNNIQKEIDKLIKQAPHKLKGKIIEPGMYKPGPQTHIHLIVSRKDRSNRYSLSPGSKYKSSEVNLHGKKVQRGFDRDRFFTLAEKRFDRQFRYSRNYAEQYTARKTLLRSPGKFYKDLLKLPTPERKLSLKLISSAPLSIIPPGKIKLAVRQLKKVIKLGMHSSSIGY